MPMSQITKKKISRALKKYHRCAKRAKCGKKKQKVRRSKRHQKKKKKKKKDDEDMSVAEMLAAQGISA